MFTGVGRHLHLHDPINQLHPGYLDPRVANSIGHIASVSFIRSSGACCRITLPKLENLWDW
jgi:hypothetical protein